MSSVMLRVGSDLASYEDLKTLAESLVIASEWRRMFFSRFVVQVSMFVTMLLVPVIVLTKGNNRTVQQTALSRIDRDILFP